MNATELITLKSYKKGFVFIVTKTIKDFRE